jgi:hypothetical protein
LLFQEITRLEEDNTKFEEKIEYQSAMIYHITSEAKEMAENQMKGG